jgi:hypothetical protein
MQLKILGLSLLALNVLVAACGGAQDDHRLADDQAALSAPASDLCGAVPPSSLQPLADFIDQAYALASVDNAQNGTNGAYASAARDNFNGISDARSKVAEMRQWLLTEGDYVPESTSYVEAYNIQANLLTVITSLTYASHWASISAVYHDSEEARDSIEPALAAVEVAHDIRVRGLRCYMGAYFNR